MRSKGQTEEGLAALGYAETIIFRPGMLWPKGGREERRLVESVAGFFMKNVVAKVFANTEISTDILGQAMMVAGQVGIEGCLRHGVGEMVKLKPMGREVSPFTIRYNFRLGIITDSGHVYNRSCSSRMTTP